MNSLQPDGYAIRVMDVSTKYIDGLVNQGKLYLFKINNKDFSEYSKGKPNLHTLYFKMLFDERNLKDVVYKLSGGAEMFYRKESIEDDEKVTHSKNEKIDMRHPHDGKKTSKFAYDIIKDRRYTVDKFFLHVPIELNFKASGTPNLNEKVQDCLRKADEYHIIGLDRGERNLVYICVIDKDGKIIKQKSLNIIESDNNYKVDYNGILNEIATKNADARKNWKTIQGIKNAKGGYLSQVVHEICKLVVEYDAIIALEDLDDEFRRSRLKVEKQVYKKFENMLISKLQYLVTEKPTTLDDGDDMKKPGGLLNAYQLSEGMKKENDRSCQNGIVFYVRAAYTSKIDPVTGFVNKIDTKYESVKKAKELIENFDAIRYTSDGKVDMFEFDTDYDKFFNGSFLHKKKWTVCTNGDRIKFKKENGNTEYEIINLTKKFKDLFDWYEVDYKNGDLKKEIMKMDASDFFKEFLEYLSLTLQMRNTDSDTDYIISPVRDVNGKFYDSRNFNKEDDVLPCDADANGAYNIARKALMIVNKIKENDKTLNNDDLKISDEEWFEYAQTFHADKNSSDSVQKI